MCYLAAPYPTPAARHPRRKTPLKNKLQERDHQGEPRADPAERGQGHRVGEVKAGERWRGGGWRDSFSAARRSGEVASAILLGE